MRKIIFCLAILVFSFFNFYPANANVISVDNLDTYLFYGDGCPHCAAEKAYLTELKKDFPKLEIHQFEIYYNNENNKLLNKVADTLNVRVDGVPFLIIGDKPFIGYTKGTTADAIRQRVEQCYTGLCPDSVGKIVGVSTIKTTSTTPTTNATTSITTTANTTLNIPFAGRIDAKNISLPLLTVIMGVLDGFNPCAMWTLIFLISLLLGMKNKKKMWLLGIAFIVASASVYFLFMAAWLNLVLFLGFIIWIRILIGILALFGGGYSLKEFATNKNAVCKVTNNETRKVTFEKIKLYVQEKSFLLSLAGIVVLAFVVNLVELVCSAGLPAVYTQILAMNHLSTWGYYGYILLYIIFFMIDDLFVFFMAMFTLQMTGITGKYARASRLIGGIVMVLVGLLLIFKPEWLMFG